MDKKSIFVVGPTASGKSALAIQIARAFDGEIISVDSRQIYRGMDIGSGKEPGRTTLSQKRGPYTQKAYISDGIPHYMIDTHHPNTIYSADKFVRRAQKIRSDIHTRDKVPIIAGGTLFWAQGLAEGHVSASVPPNDTLRKKYSTYTSQRLLDILQKKDSRRARQLIERNEINNRVRLIRSLEIVEALGSVPPTPPVDYKLLASHTLILAITPPQEILHKKIEKRMDMWFETGIFDEVLMLHHEMRVPWVRIESFGLEYKWSVRYIRGSITFDEMRENTIRDLKHYAKRQMTWIRRWERQGAHISHTNDTEGALRISEEFINKH